MSSTRRRLSRLALATGAALALTGCIALPPALPTTPPALPTETESAPEPVETEPVETQESEPSTAPDDGGLPEYVDFGTALPPGTLAGWETGILTDDAFAPQPDSDFPAGPTIHVIETATGCDFWAYQGAPDLPDADEYASSEATLAALSETAPEEWDAETLDLSPSASQGVAVAFLSIYTEDEETGDTTAFFARNFESSGSTSAIRATCSGAAGGIEHIDEVIAEHFQINFLEP